MQASGGFHPSQDDIHNLEAARSHQNAPQNPPGAPSVPGHPDPAAHPPTGHYSELTSEQLAHVRKEYDHHRTSRSYRPPTPSDEEIERIKQALSDAGDGQQPPSAV
jgi:hypothetical protein